MTAVDTNLAKLAGVLPTQHTRAATQTRAKPIKPKESKPKEEERVGESEEEIIQFSFGLRKSLRKQLAQLAMDEDTTMRAFVLNALKEKGLTVTNDDLLDMRKSKNV